MCLTFESMSAEHPHFRCRFEDSMGSCDRSCCITLLVSATRALAPGGVTTGEFHQGVGRFARITRRGLEVILDSWQSNCSVTLHEFPFYLQSLYCQMFNYQRRVWYHSRGNDEHWVNCQLCPLQFRARRLQRSLSLSARKSALGLKTPLATLWYPVITNHMAMDQYLLIPFLGEWTSIYQLFWCSPGVQGFDTLPYIDHLAFATASFSSIVQICCYCWGQTRTSHWCAQPQGLMILRVSQRWGEPCAASHGKPLVSERPLLTSSNYLWLQSLWSLTSWICSDLFKICSRFPGFIKWSSAFKCQYAGNIGGIGGTWGIVWD